MNQQIEFTRIFPELFYKRLNQLFPAPFAGPVVIDLIALTYSLGQEKELSPITGWLSESEKEHFISFKFQKRYVEWLGGRLCAKKTLTDYIQKFHSLQIIPPPRDLIVHSQQNGRPFFQCDQLGETGIKPDLSISHGGRYGMAMVSKTWCGIDIQEQQSSLEKVKEKYCTQVEGNLLQSILSAADVPPLHGLTLLWAAKEALKKMLSKLKMIGFLDITLIDIECIDETTYIFRMRLADKLLPSNHIDIVTVSYNSYGIALCQLPSTLSTTLNDLLKHA